MRQKPLGLGEERIHPDETEIVREIVASNVKTLTRENGVAKRGQHSKHHGCVDARFTVLPGIPEYLRKGVFAAEATHQAIVRFSNGKTTDDREPDAHGMAIKLLDIPGDKLINTPGAESHHDFILADHPVFFVKGIDEYMLFSKHFGNLLGFKKNRRGLFGFVKSLVALKVVHRDLTRRAKSFSRQTPCSPVATNYWSTVPYRLGETAVKYKIISPETSRPSAGVTSRDGLSEALMADLGTRSITLTFGVHVQTDPARHPVEDPTVNWEVNGAEFVPLAEIEIAKQTVNPTDQKAEDLVFSPWHALEAHRPIGAVNRVRKTVYEEMAHRRHEMNGIARRRVG